MCEGAGYVSAAAAAVPGDKRVDVSPFFPDSFSFDPFCQSSVVRMVVDLREIHVLYLEKIGFALDAYTLVPGIAGGVPDSCEAQRVYSIYSLARMHSVFFSIALRVEKK